MATKPAAVVHGFDLLQIVPVASQTRAKRATRSSTQSSQVAARLVYCFGVV